MRQIVEEALARAMPEWSDKLRAGVRADMDERFELLGLAAADYEDRAEIRKDMEFVRVLRTVFKWAATKIGGAVLTAFLLGAAALAGYGTWVKGWFAK